MQRTGKRRRKDIQEEPRTVHDQNTFLVEHIRVKTEPGGKDQGIQSGMSPASRTVCGSVWVKKQLPLFPAV